MTYHQNITPDAAVRYIEAHGIEVRTAGVSCLTIIAHYVRNGVSFSRIVGNLRCPQNPAAVHIMIARFSAGYRRAANCP